MRHDETFAHDRATSPKQQRPGRSQPAVAARSLGLRKEASKRPALNVTSANKMQIRSNLLFLSVSEWSIARPVAVEGGAGSNTNRCVEAAKEFLGWLTDSLTV